MYTDLAGAAPQETVSPEAKQCEELPADAGDQLKPVNGEGAGAAADSAYASPAGQEGSLAAKASSDKQGCRVDEPDAGECCCSLLF